MKIGNRTGGTSQSFMRASTWAGAHGSLSHRKPKLGGRRWTIRTPRDQRRPCSRGALMSRAPHRSRRPAHPPARPEDKVPPTLLIRAGPPPSSGGATRIRSRQPIPTTGGLHVQRPRHEPRRAPAGQRRAETLTAIGTKWNKLSKQEVSEPKTKGELVTLVVARYGVEKTAAQREVDGLMPVAASRRDLDLNRHA
jgi:hypothetical protein